MFSAKCSKFCSAIQKIIKHIPYFWCLRKIIEDSPHRVNEHLMVVELYP